MIDYASHILQLLMVATDQAFNELNTPLTCGGNLAPDLEEAAQNAYTGGPSGPVRRDSPILAIVQIIQQTTDIVAIIEQISPELALQRTMSQIARELASEIDVLTDEERPERFADCSVFIEKDKFMIAANVAAAQVVAVAAASMSVLDSDVLSASISNQLDRDNPLMLPHLAVLRAAAKECGIVPE